MNRCRPEKQSMKERGNIPKIILELEEGGVPDKEAEGWNLRKRGGS